MLNTDKSSQLYSQLQKIIDRQPALATQILQYVPAENQLDIALSAKCPSLNQIFVIHGIKLKEIQRNYDAIGLSIHSTQSISALKSATELQKPSRDKILKFLHKDYTQNVVKDQIRLSLEKQPATYSGKCGFETARF